MPNGIDEAAVRAVLADFKDPETGRSVVQMEQIGDVRVADDRVSLTLALSTHSAPLWEETRKALAELLQSRLPQAKAVDVRLAVHKRPAQPQGEMGLTAKSVIAVGSGKRGRRQKHDCRQHRAGVGTSGQQGWTDGRRRLRTEHSAPVRHRADAAAAR